MADSDSSPRGCRGIHLRDKYLAIIRVSGLAAGPLAERPSRPVAKLNLFKWHGWCCPQAC
eukprot:294863-Rhodomonas_salina.1